MLRSLAFPFIVLVALIKQAQDVVVENTPICFKWDHWLSHALPISLKCWVATDIARLWEGRGKSDTTIHLSTCQTCSCCNIYWVSACSQLRRFEQSELQMWWKWLNGCGLRVFCFSFTLKFQVKLRRSEVKVHAIVRASVKLGVWAAAEPSATSAQMFCTDHIKCADLVHFFVRNKLNTRKVSSLNSSPSVFWYRGRLNSLSGLLLTCPILPLSLPVSHFCRMFLLSWVPIVHTLSWLASQGCCWLLGPLIGSSCALAFLACLGLAFAWFSLL